MVRRKCTLFLPSIIKKSRLKENFMKKSVFTLVIDILDSQVFILKSHWWLNLKYSSYLKLSHGANKTLVGVHVLVGRASSISVRLFKQKTIWLTVKVPPAPPRPILITNHLKNINITRSYRIVMSSRSHKCNYKIRHTQNNFAAVILFCYKFIQNSQKVNRISIYLVSITMFKKLWVKFSLILYLTCSYCLCFRKHKTWKYL